ncbi:GNAT family N-acetyltransferase [Paenibacillus sp. DCT19]|uniref:GNAT family N-acetyltransferase n=1 Tax=Paenibacillus sp. DCT19 TaxID=2211212 RepID=UPI0020C5415B|nr:GNAT family N-acetyltransferase [Paenibacillus sp. DCT19]
MSYSIHEMTVGFAEEILHWKYEQPYDFYDNELSLEALDELLNSSYYVLLDIHDELIGFMCMGSSAQVPNETYVYGENYIDLGIGMNPELTGKGQGASFFSSVLNFIVDRFDHSSYRLTVAAFNQTAIHLYQKFGFITVDRFSKGDYEFIVMIK